MDDHKVSPRFAMGIGPRRCIRLRLVYLCSGAFRRRGEPPLSERTQIIGTGERQARRMTSCMMDRVRRKTLHSARSPNMVRIGSKARESHLTWSGVLRSEGALAALIKASISSRSR